MGTAPRRKPARLAEKLVKIRDSLKLSQNGMIRKLGLTDELTQAEISAYERGVRIPSLPVLLNYAKVSGVWMDVLVDDDLDLPEGIPSAIKSKGVSHSPETKKRSR